MDPYITYAELVPKTYVYSSSKSQQQLLQTTPPEVSSALYSVYPFIIAANKILSLITWTGESPYTNFVIVAVYGVLVLHWGNFCTFILPTLVCLIFCCSIWFVKTTFVDFTKEEIPPTLEEIMDSLTNLNLRLEILFSPIMNPTRLNDLKKLLVTACLMTPFNIFIMSKLITIRTWFFLVGVHILTYNSNWFVASRRIFWRWKGTRELGMFFTGLNFSLLDKELEFTMASFNLKDTADPSTKMVEFEILENERRWIGMGWTGKLLFLERQHLTSIDLRTCCPDLDSFQFPQIKGYEKSEWKWLDSNWKIEYTLEGNKEDGWTYFDNSWEHPLSEDSITSYTRSRKLKRKALLVLEKSLSNSSV